MSEWFKEHDWQSCVGLKPTGGSNPLLCAKKRQNISIFCLFLYLIGWQENEGAVYHFFERTLRPFFRMILWLFATNLLIQNISFY